MNPWCPGAGAAELVPAVLGAPVTSAPNCRESRCGAPGTGSPSRNLAGLGLGIATSDTLLQGNLKDTLIAPERALGPSGGQEAPPGVVWPFAGGSVGGGIYSGETGS